MKIVYYINKYFSNPLISFIYNLIYWIFNIFNLNQSIITSRSLKVNTLDDVIEIMSKFKWTKDRIIDWNPWVITIINNDYKDDCDGAAVLGKELLKRIGIKSKRYNLHGKTGHAVTISDNKNILISNNTVIKLKTNDWKKEVLDHFNNKYKYII